MHTAQEWTSTRAKVHQRALQARSKPGQRRQQDFWEIETGDQNFLNKKNRKF